MQNISFTSISSKFGIPFGLFLIAYTLILFLLDIDKITWVGASVYLIYLIAIVIFIKQVKAAQNGIITFSEGFKVGFYASLTASIISSLYLIIHTQFVDVHYFETLIEIEKQKLIDRGITEEKLKPALDATAAFLKPAISIPISFVSIIFISMILSAISAAVMKKE